MTVREYISKFNELSRFGMDLVNTPYKKTLKFAKGLNQPHQGLLLTHVAAGASFESLVEMALMMDIGKTESSKEVATTAKPKEGRIGEGIRKTRKRIWDHRSRSRKMSPSVMHVEP